MRKLPMTNNLSFRFQVIGLSITTLIIVVLIGLQLKKFCAADKPPKLTQVSAEHPIRVETGITITDFPTFDVWKNNFEFVGVIWFRFDPTQVDLETIGKFTLIKGTITDRSEPIVTREGSMMIARYRARATFRCDLYYGYFPFEDHTLSIELVNRSLDSDKVTFVSGRNQFLLDDPHISGWYYSDHRVTTGFDETLIGTQEGKKEILFPVVLFEIDFFHHSIRYVFTTLLPLLIIFFIDMFSLCFDQRKDHAKLVGMTTANLAALISYRFVIEGRSPSVGYTTVADTLYYLFLTTTFVVFLVNCVGPYLSIRQKKIFSICVQTLIVACVFYLLDIWIPC